MIKKIYNFIKKSSLTPDQFFLLYGLSKGTIILELDDKSNFEQLLKNGYILPNKKVTAKGQKILDLFENAFNIVKPKKSISVDEDKIKEYNELFPKKRLPTGKLARTNIKTLKSAFEWFFSNYDYDWDTVMEATKMYLDERELDNWKFTRTSQYFIRKQENGKGWTSNLADYCEIVKSGGYDDTEKTFKEKVY